MDKAIKKSANDLIEERNEVQGRIDKLTRFLALRSLSKDGGTLEVCREAAAVPTGAEVNAFVNTVLCRLSQELIDLGIDPDKG